MSTDRVEDAPDEARLELSAPLVGERIRPAREGTAPSAAEIDALLGAALAAPDHGRLRPFRFAVVSGEGRRRVAEALACDMASESPGGEPGDTARRAERKAFAAPCLVAIISSPDRGAAIPLWEQVASATCAGFAIVLAAQLLGLGSVWKSPPVRDGAALSELFGLRPDEQLLGWVLVGSPHSHARRAHPGGPDGRALAMSIDG